MIQPQPLQNPITKSGHFIEWLYLGLYFNECGKNSAISEWFIVAMNNVWSVC